MAGLAGVHADGIFDCAGIAGAELTRRIDLTGRRFDKLICIADVGTKFGSRLWLCQCDCGNHVSKRAGVLTAENQRQLACRACGEIARQESRIKHGGSTTALHRAWVNMRQRCNSKNPKYRYWNGKGIKVCDEWQTFPWFREWALANGYAEGLSLDRINPDGNYEPSNCRWVTVSQNTVFSLDRRYGK
jgi:hypothetical protein